MAIYDSFKTKQGSTILIWKISETLNDLENQSKNELIESFIYSSLKTDKRKKEWLATRLLLNFFFKEEDVSILYNKERKPFLSNNINISISHSGDYVTLILNKSIAVGIDIQVFKKNISKGASLFMTANELKEVGEKNRLSKLHIYWCAKETMFKHTSVYELNLFSDFYIQPFDINTNRIVGEVISTKKKIELNTIVSENYYLVFTD